MDLPRPHPTHFAPNFQNTEKKENLKLKTTTFFLFLEGIRPRDHAHWQEHHDGSAVSLNESSVRPNPISLVTQPNLVEFIEVRMNLVKIFAVRINLVKNIRGSD